jgi:hypothetical protein
MIYPTHTHIFYTFTTQQVMVSPQVWQLLKNLPGGFTAAHKFEDGYVSIDVHAPFEPIRQRRIKPFLNDDVDDHFPLLEQRIKGYVPNSVNTHIHVHMLGMHLNI